MIKDINNKSSKKILIISIFILFISLIFNVLQFKKNKELQKNLEACKKENFINNSTINDLEYDKQELENEIEDKQ